MILQGLSTRRAKSEERTLLRSANVGHSCFSRCRSVNTDRDFLKSARGCPLLRKLEAGLCGYFVSRSFVFITSRNIAKFIRPDSTFGRSRKRQLQRNVCRELLDYFMFVGRGGVFPVKGRTEFSLSVCGRPNGVGFSCVTGLLIPGAVSRYFVNRETSTGGLRKVGSRGSG